MNVEELEERNLESEFKFSTSRSSGPGGQNVNKVSSKVELRFDLLHSQKFTEEEKDLIFRKLKNKINKEGEIVLKSQSGRSQLMNKLAVTAKFYDLVSRALTIPVKRKPSVRTPVSKLKRLESKRYNAYKKQLRKSAGESAEA